MLPASLENHLKSLFLNAKLVQAAKQRVKIKLHVWLVAEALFLIKNNKNAFAHLINIW